MTVDGVFQLANMLALGGWLMLVFSPLAPRLAQILGATAIPVLLSALYAALILAFWTRAEGGFGSLDDVAALFETRELLLAGWVHYLAFDLFVGAWISRSARDQGMSHLFVIPILILTFLFGPAGYLAFRIAQTALPDRNPTLQA